MPSRARLLGPTLAATGAVLLLAFTAGGTSAASCEGTDTEGCPVKLHGPPTCGQLVGAVGDDNQFIEDIVRNGFEIPISCQREDGHTLLYPTPIKVTVEMKVRAPQARILGTSRTIISEREASPGRTKKIQGGKTTFWKVQLPAKLKSALRSKGVKKLDGTFELALTLSKEDAGSGNPVIRFGTAHDIEEGNDIPSFQWVSDSFDGCKHVTLYMIYGCSKA